MGDKIIFYFLLEEVQKNVGSKGVTTLPKLLKGACFLEEKLLTSMPVIL